MLWFYPLITFGVYILYSTIFAAYKKKKPFKRAFVIMLSGIVVLMIVNLASKFSGVYLPVSPLTLTTSSCLGMPGVAVMMVLSWLM